MTYLFGLFLLLWSTNAWAVQLTATWTAPTSGGVPTGYVLERSGPTSGAFAQVASVAATVLTYADTSVAAGGSYCYRVKAVNAGGDSPYSETACAIAPALRLTVKVGVFRPSTGQWLLDVNTDSIMNDCETSPSGCAIFGQSGDLPVVGNWTGTGAASKIGIYRTSTQQWILDANNTHVLDTCGTDTCVTYAWQSTDLPVVGRWTTGDALTHLGVYRPSTGCWYLDSAVSSCVAFGNLIGLPVVGDWNNSGTGKFGVFVPSTGLWKLDKNGNGTLDACGTDSCFGPFGSATSLPIAGDWTGTNVVRIGVFLPNTGQWQFDLNNNGTFDGCVTDGCLGPFGQKGDIPVVGRW